MLATRYGVDPKLAHAVVRVESNYQTRALSPKGAQGLMQLMPATAANLDVKDSFDTRKNIEGGVRHLRVLMDRYHNDLPLVLAAYNAGDTAVINYRGVPPYRETRQYVVQVLRRFDREAARAAAQRIYGSGPPRPAASYPRTRLAVIQVYGPAYGPAPSEIESTSETIAPAASPPSPPPPLGTQGP